jgi:hypothetical protein
MQGLRRDLYKLATSQRSLVTRADLRALGFSAGRRRGLLADGTLAPIGRQTFVLGGAAHDPLRAILAACLDSGGVASHRTAAVLHGIPGSWRSAKPDVLVRRRGTPNVATLAHLHTTTWLPADDVIEVEGIPATSIARTLILLAGMVPVVSVEQVRGAVDDAIRMGKATDPWLWWRLEKVRCRGRAGVSVMEEVLSGRAGGEVTESWLEREFLRIIEGTGLPAPVCQRRVRARGAFVARVDFLYEELGIVIEVTGAVGHSTREQRAADARRRNQLGTLGLLVLEFTYEQVVGSPQDVIAAIWDAIGARRRRGLSA